MRKGNLKRKRKRAQRKRAQRALIAAALRALDPKPAPRQWDWSLPVPRWEYADGL